MKKTLLGIAALLTAANLAVGVAYGAACEGTNGKQCGTDCVTTPAGACSCTGTCTDAEKKWKSGTGFAEMEELAY